MTTVSATASTAVSPRGMRETSNTAALAVRRIRRGRAVRIERDGTLYLGHRNRIFESRDDGASWRLAATIPCAPWRSLAGRCRLAARLLRHEVRALVRLTDGTLVAANRQGVFRAALGETQMSPSRIDDRDGPVAPPLTISVGPGDRVIWSEYKSEPYHGRPVRVYASDDGGRSFEVAHVFAPGDILHLHNLIHDPRENVYWILSGDWDGEPGIGRMSADLARVAWLHRGKQDYRAVEMFDFGDHLLYATDSDLAPNALMRLDKATGAVTRLRELEGSCIYACRFGGIFALSTTVELSKVNRSQEAALYLSRDGDQWQRVYAAPKDAWHRIYFQFGSLVLPRGASERETIFLSGQAVRGIDDWLLAGRWENPA